MNRLLTTILFGLFIFLTLTCPSGPAIAQGEAETATARQLAKDAFKAFDDKDYVRAEDLFGRAEKLHHAPTLLLGLARSQAALGKFVEARENFHKVMREKLDSSAPDVFKKAVDNARAEVKQLEGKIAWVIINVTGAADPEVTLDGTAIANASLGVKRAINPGKHLLSARAKDALTKAQHFTIAEGESKPVNITLEISSPGEVVPKPPAKPEDKAPAKPVISPDDDEPGSTQRVVGYVALGLGVVGVALGAVGGIIAIDKHGQLEENCPNEECPVAQEGTLDSYTTTHTLSTVGFVIGGVFAAAGVVLLLTAPSSEPEGATVALRVGVGQLHGTVSF